MYMMRVGRDVASFKAVANSNSLEGTGWAATRAVLGRSRGENKFKYPFAKSGPTMSTSDRVSNCVESVGI